MKSISTDTDNPLKIGRYTISDDSEANLDGNKFFQRHAVIVGRSHIVGKPLIQLLLDENATVTVCHSRTQELAQFTKSADLLIVAIGRPNFITADMVKDGAVVIDVGINRLETGKLVGDVAFDEVEPKVSYITPVPGGVGPMTITMLLRNTLEAAKRLK